MSLPPSYSRLLVSAALAVTLTACAPADRRADDATTEVDAVVLADPAMVVGLPALAPDPALLTGTLDNGVVYAILHNETPPGRAALRVRFDTGSFNELPGTAGLAHYLEHMAFNGSENVPEGEMIQMLERLGLSFGADTNATTGIDRTVYKLNLPNTESDVLDAAFMLMRETAENLTLDEDAIDRELGIILSEKRTRDSANYRAWEASMGLLSRGSDAMSRLPIGTEDTLRAIQSDDFRAYYEAHYHPEKTVVVFVGDADPKAIEARIKDTFGDWMGAGEPGETLKPTPATTEPGQVVVYEEEGLPTQVRLMSIRPYVDREDTSERRREETLRRLAFAIMSYRMQALAEQVDRPFVNASMGSHSTFDLTEGSTFFAYTQPENWERALRGLETELRRALEHGFTQSELDTQMARFEASIEASAEGADTRPTTARRGGLTASLMSTFETDRVFTHPSQNLTRFMAMRDTLTLEAVNTQLRHEWGDMDDLSVLMQTSDAPDDIETQIQAALSDSRAQPVSAPEVVADKPFAYEYFGAPGTIVSDSAAEDVEARLIEFENNVRLTVKQTDFQDDRVLIKVAFGDGMLSTPERNEGLRRMALSVISESGLEAHEPNELRRLLAGRLVASNSFSAQAGGDAFVFSTLTVPDDMLLQFQIYAAQLSAQAFRERSRVNHIDKMKEWYPRHDTTINGVFAKHVQRRIYGGDERFGFENEDQFYSPELNEVKAWLRPQFEQGAIEVTVVGDVDPDDVIGAVARTLGALPSRQVAGADDNPSVAAMRQVSFGEPSEGPTVFRHKGDDNQAQLRLYWPADDGMDPIYARQLSVLRGVLRNRLVKDIREGEATTYSPGAASHASTIFDGFGYMLAVLTLKPEDVDDMSDKVRAIAADLASGNISEDEFNRALKPIIERLESGEKTNDYWANVLDDAQSEARGLAAHRSRMDDFENMRVADVRGLAETVFDPDRALDIRILPADE
ncbi:MAG: insulinase family protein [Litorimonas sp.]